MADPVFDLDEATPNVALNRLRLAVLSTDDLYLLVDMLLGLLDGALTSLGALTARVTALEPPPVPTDPEEPLP